MMRDVVLVPTFARPEYLALCLEFLGKATRAFEKEIWISHDSHNSDGENVTESIETARAIARRSAPSFATVRFSVRSAHRYWGNPCNIMESYKEAFAEPSVRFVYLIEDDVLVDSDFFRWHEAVQDQNDYFCTVGWDCRRNRHVSLNDDPTAYVETTVEYAGIGVCWRRANLAPLVRHACVQYYENCEGYLRRTFPECPIPPGKWIEQAGLVLRLLHEAKNRTVAWPTRRRCSHVGVHGYHRPSGHRFEGVLEDRIAHLRAAIADGRIASMAQEYIREIDSPRESVAWNESDLRLVQSVPYARTYQNDAG